MILLKRRTLQKSAADLDEVWVMKKCVDDHEETSIVGLEDSDVCVFLN
jgi:hypothetical protein